MSSNNSSKELQTGAGVGTEHLSKEEKEQLGSPTDEKS